MLRLEGKLTISMSQTVDSKIPNVNDNLGEQQCVDLSSASQFFHIKNIKDEKSAFSPAKGLTSYLGYCCSSLWFIFNFLHSSVILEFFVHIVGSNPIALPKRVGIVSFGVP